MKQHNDTGKILSSYAWDLQVGKSIIEQAGLGHQMVRAKCPEEAYSKMKLACKCTSKKRTPESAGGFMIEHVSLGISFVFNTQLGKNELPHGFQFVCPTKTTSASAMKPVHKVDTVEKAVVA